MEASLMAYTEVKNEQTREVDPTQAILFPLLLNNKIRELLYDWRCGALLSLSMLTNFSAWMQPATAPHRTTAGGRFLQAQRKKNKELMGAQCFF